MTVIKFVFHFCFLKYYQMYCSTLLYIGVKIIPLTAACSPLDDPNFGSVTTHYNSTIKLFVAEYSCKDDFTIVGDNQRYCHDSGYWSGKKPYCVAGNTK